jgi:hypothetical protein
MEWYLLSGTGELYQYLFLGKSHMCAIRKSKTVILIGDGYNIKIIPYHLFPYLRYQVL